MWHPRWRFIPSKAVVLPVKACIQDAHSAETALGGNANFEVAAEIRTIFCILVSTTLSRGIPGKFTSLQHFPQKSQRQELSFVLKPSLSDSKLSNRAGNKPPAAGRS
jgi:hypothetical protein